MKKNCIIPEFNSWFEIEFYPIIDQLYFFNKAIDSPRPLDTKKDLRSYAAKLLESHEITINEYVSIFGGHAIYHLTEGENGKRP
ncbi:MAG TPA: hypothetical protein VJY63_06875 [Marinospirillum sp.]|uniref:hypothetical protein n=1 Tax=Marinospirillum sp. TaxID=2183934 RepID=UPI002B46A15B|nr:hypothetical protein [Marinospirillum sp.]HKM15628.1 hypothetical protein [Marinospirillum sp.]